MEGTSEFGNELSGSVKCGEFLEQLKKFSFSRRTLIHGVRNYYYYYYYCCYYY